MKKLFVWGSIFWTAWALCVPPTKGLEKYNQYLMRIKTLRAQVRQTSPEQKIFTGVLYLSKPGRMRLIYNPKGKSQQLICNGDRFVFYDDLKKESDDTAMENTPLAFLLKPNMPLEKVAFIKKFIPGKKWTQIIMSSLEDPEGPEIKLVFQENPLRFYGWTLMDFQNQKTQVVLEKLEINPSLPPDIFRLNKK